MGCRPVRLDVTSESELADAIGGAADISADIDIDIVVNAAGISQGGPMEELPLAALRRQFEMNVRAGCHRAPSASAVPRRHRRARDARAARSAAEPDVGSAVARDGADAGALTWQNAQPPDPAPVHLRRLLAWLLPKRRTR